MLTSPASSEDRSGRLILYVVNDARWFLTHRLPVARGAQAAGYDVHVATPFGPFVDAIRREHFVWHRVEFARGSTNPFKELWTLLSFVRLYRRVRPDLVHHVSAKPVLYGTIAARLVHVPAIVNAVTGLGHVFLADDFRHAAIRSVLGLAYRIVMRHGRLRVIFQNDDDRNLFLKRKWTRAVDSMLISSGVDLDAFRPGERRTNTTPLVILPARLIYTKGVGEFVDAARKLKSNGVNARFALVGGPDPQNPACIPEHQIAEWASSGVVEVWGERSDMPAVYKEADIVCLPSYREGMPKALIEAAASALPAVTTDVPGCRDVVRDGETGYLVPVRDSDVLADRLRHLVMDAGLRVRLGHAARQRAETQFSSSVYSKRTIAIYRELLS